jgi:hypothetical protein
MRVKAQRPHIAQFFRELGGKPCSPVELLISSARQRSATRDFMKECICKRRNVGLYYSHKERSKTNWRMYYHFVHRDYLM